MKQLINYHLRNVDGCRLHRIFCVLSHFLEDVGRDILDQAAIGESVTDPGDLRLVFDTHERHVIDNGRGHLVALYGCCNVSPDLCKLLCELTKDVSRCTWDIWVVNHGRVLGLSQSTSVVCIIFFEEVSSLIPNQGCDTVHAACLLYVVKCDETRVVKIEESECVVNDIILPLRWTRNLLHDLVEDFLHLVNGHTELLNYTHHLVSHGM
mmetsp:Transcript_96153/g.176696  ORF Transcript_96153/g.176696 Transcript_96153/m.176696 type:complete len:209 (-) Transcript_96153:801-1427(-)